jgi:hypothetical protein
MAATTGLPAGGARHPHGQDGHDQLIALARRFSRRRRRRPTGWSAPGDDTFVIDNVATRPSRMAAAAPTSSRAPSALAMDASVENVTLTGVARSNATGNGLDNLMIGNSAANELNGFTGVDEYARRRRR